MKFIPSLTRWSDKSGHPFPGHSDLQDIRSNLVQQELSRMNINSVSLLDKTVQVTQQLMRMLGGLLEREVIRDDPEWAAAMASLTVSEKVKFMPSRRQHKENERDCRTIVQQLVSSIPQNVLTSTSYKRKEHVKGTQNKTVTFEDQDQWGEEVERNLEQDYLSGETNGEESRQVQDQNLGQESLSGESDVEEKNPDEEQDLEDEILSGEFRWMTERTKLIRKRERAPSQTLQLMTTRGIQESTPTQTGTRAQDRNCQSWRSTQY